MRFHCQRWKVDIMSTLFNLCGFLPFSLCLFPFKPYLPPFILALPTRFAQFVLQSPSTLTSKRLTLFRIRIFEFSLSSSWFAWSVALWCGSSRDKLMTHIYNTWDVTPHEHTKYKRPTTEDHHFLSWILGVRTNKNEKLIEWQWETFHSSLLITFCRTHTHKCYVKFSQTPPSTSRMIWI